MIANARMYAVNARVAAGWARLFTWIADRAGVALDVVAHPPPLPLEELWRRDDLGCAFMCGYPWSTWRDAARPRLLAVPQPSPDRYAGGSVYCTDLIVRTDSAHTDIGSLRGTRFAYTIESSQSGWQAPRAMFASAALAAGGRWFGKMVGPLLTPRAVLDAVVGGQADAGPLDSYWHDLLRRHEPATAAKLRTLASTPMTPMPPLVCAASTSDTLRSRLIAALEDVGAAAALRDVRAALLIRGFVAATADDYAVLSRLGRDTDALGYLRLQ